MIETGHLFLVYKKDMLFLSLKRQKQHLDNNNHSLSHTQYQNRMLKIELFEEL